MSGRTIGPYQIMAEIGRGGMATVYKGYDPVNRRYVAIKVLPPDLSRDQEFVERFRREAAAAGRLRHPNIVAIYDVQPQAGLYAIVMEYVEGQSLAALIRQGGAMPPQRAAAIVAQIASALDYAHSQGVVHRDVKPSNILLAPSGRAVLTDFGIARLSTDRTLTRTGAIIGTPEYMSPEQAQGETVMPQSDVYSLGVVLYEMLTGRVPFSGPTHAVLLAHITRLPPPPRALNPALTPAVEAAVLRALAKAPAERYRSAGEMAQALAIACRWQPGWPVQPLPAFLSGQRVVPGLTGAKPVTPAGLAPGSANQKTLWAVLGGVALLLILLVVVVLAVNAPLRDGTVTPISWTPTISILYAGEYPQGKTYVSTLPQGVEKTFTLDRVEVLTDGTMRFQVRLGVRIAPGSAATAVAKQSDTGNRDMYLTDAQGNRYDHTQVGGDFARDVSLANGQTISGWFLFPPPKAGARVFTFHVDDEGFRLTDIRVGK